MSATILLGDCREQMATLEDCSVDAVVCDPPYELGFMGKKWDASGIANDVEVWRQCLRVLKPGGHLVAFGGTRTSHRMVCSIEDAGFEIRDSLIWIYGCLSDDTEILINGQWEPYHKAIAGSLTMCYDMDSNEYSWKPIEDLFVYDYDDIAYRVVSDSTDQIVTKQHRCIVERGGTFGFEFAEDVARQHKARVPVLESVRDLLDVLPVHDARAGDEKQDVLEDVSRRDVGQVQASQARTQRDVLGVRKELLPSTVAPCESCKPEVLTEMQRQGTRSGVGEARAQGAGGMDGRGAGVVQVEDVRREQSGMEGRRYLLSEEGQLRADQVRPMSVGVSGDVSQGRIHHGAPADSCSCNGSHASALGGGASREPRSAGQPNQQSVTLREQQRSQTVRASRYTRTDVARFEPLHYTGKVWCVKVPTGAFVARRNGKVFITGNSGFPKSLNVSKAIDKAAGAEREVTGKANGAATSNTNSLGVFASEYDSTAPATDAARKWEGFGTALKPAHEPAVLARKPLSGTVAATVLEHGTGALNIDGCRVGTSKRVPGGISQQKPNAQCYGTYGIETGDESGHNPNVGRWPPNLLLSHAAECADTCAADCPVRELGEQSGESKSAQHTRGCGIKVGKHNSFGDDNWQPNDEFRHMERGHADTGTAARFFPRFRYQAKASRKERELGCESLPLMGSHEITGRKEGSAGQMHARAGTSGRSGRRNIHPTVKPIALMQWLVRLVTPPGGLVLDPFTGSGSTGIAAIREGFRFVGCELSPEYANIARARIGAARLGDSEDAPSPTPQKVDDKQTEITW